MKIGIMAFVTTAALALLVGCGGSSGSSDATGTSSGSGAMTVHLVDGPISGFQQVNLNIQSVAIAANGSWTTLAAPDKMVNLLSLVGGVDATLASGASLPAGHYDQMRLLLGPGSTVMLADGTVHALTVPSGMQSGVKLVVDFDVAAGTTKDVFIDFDAAHSIQVVQTGASNKYMLRPTVRACDKVVTGTISGRLTDAATSTGLPGALVYAETLDGSGHPGILRTAVTDATGAYTLDLLPIGTTCYVVSQPAVGTATITTYDAKASDGFALTSATPVFTYDAAFTADAATGVLGGAITPLAASDQSDSVALMQALATPASGTATFIVATAMATVGTSTETYAFPQVPAGAYSVQATRATEAMDGSVSLSSSTVQPATVVASATTTVDLAL